MSSLLFIYNPNSGMKTVSRKLSDIINLYTAAGWDVIVHPTQSGEDCVETAKRFANSVERVIVAGGDGTLNGAVNGFMQAGLERPFGYIPCGSTNDFSHSLGIPTQLMKAAENAITGRPFGYDIGCMNGKFFNYVSGFGAFTEITYTTPQNQKNAIGYFAYLISGAASLPNITPHHVRFKSDMHSGEGDYILGLVTNTLQVGGMKNLLPQDISLNDGIFEVLLVKNPKNPVELNKILVSAVKHDFKADCFDYFKTADITFECEKPLPWNLDGENGGSYKKAHITCRREALKIITRR